MIEENKTEKSVQQEPIKNKSNKDLVIIIIVIGMTIAFGCGILFGQKLFEKNDNNKKEEQQEEKEEPVISQNEEKIDVKDTYTVSTYGESLKLYIIKDGKVYLKLMINCLLD